MLRLIRETWGEILGLFLVGAGFWYVLEPPIGDWNGILSGLCCAFVLPATLLARGSIGTVGESNCRKEHYLDIGWVRSYFWLWCFPLDMLYVEVIW